MHSESQADNIIRAHSTSLVDNIVCGVLCAKEVGATSTSMSITHLFFGVFPTRVCKFGSFRCSSSRGNAKSKVGAKLSNIMTDNSVSSAKWSRACWPRCVSTPIAYMM